MNLVERWFGKITADRIRRAMFTSVAELERAIHDYIEFNNANRTPFVWTKSANDIILKMPSVQERMKGIGADLPAPARRTPEYLQKFVESEIEKWAGPIKTLGMTVE